MTTTEHHEHARTEEALEELTSWGRNPTSDGGENLSLIHISEPTRPY